MQCSNTKYTTHNFSYKKDRSTPVKSEAQNAAKSKKCFNLTSYFSVFIYLSFRCAIAMLLSIVLCDGNYTLFGDIKTFLTYINIWCTDLTCGISFLSSATRFQDLQSYGSCFSSVVFVYVTWRCWTLLLNTAHFRSTWRVPMTFKWNYWMFCYEIWLQHSWWEN